MYPIRREIWSQLLWDIILRMLIIMSKIVSWADKRSYTALGFPGIQYTAYCKVICTNCYTMQYKRKLRKRTKNVESCSQKMENFPPTDSISPPGYALFVIAMPVPLYFSCPCPQDFFHSPRFPPFFWGPLQLFNILFLSYLSCWPCSLMYKCFENVLKYFLNFPLPYFLHQIQCSSKSFI